METPAKDLKNRPRRSSASEGDGLEDMSFGSSNSPSDIQFQMEIERCLENIHDDASFVMTALGDSPSPIPADDDKPAAASTPHITHQSSPFDFDCATFNGTTCKYQVKTGRPCKYKHNAVGPDPVASGVPDNANFSKQSATPFAPALSILSPSHLHLTNLCTLSFSTQARLSQCTLHAYVGLPNFSEIVFQTVKHHSWLVSRGKTSKPFVWMVSDYRFGNYADGPSSHTGPHNTGTTSDDTEEQGGVKMTRSSLWHSPFAPVDVAPPRMFAVEKARCTNSDDQEQVRRSLEAIDNVVDLLPSVQLVFWCLATREETSKRHQHGGNFGEGAYKRVQHKYKKNFVDIREFVKSRGFSMKDVTRDHGAHPNDLGIKLLLECLEEHRVSREENTGENNECAEGNSAGAPQHDAGPCSCGIGTEACGGICWATCVAICTTIILWLWCVRWTTQHLGAIVTFAARFIVGSLHRMIEPAFFRAQRYFAIVRPRPRKK